MFAWMEVGDKRIKDKRASSICVLKDILKKCSFHINLYVSLLKKRHSSYIKMKTAILSALLKLGLLI